MTIHPAAAPAATASIADTLEDLTPAWFTAVLRDGGTLGEGSSVTVAPTDGVGAGPVGAGGPGGRVGVGGGGGAVVGGARVPDHARRAPASLIVKLPSPDAGSRQMG